MSTGCAPFSSFFSFSGITFAMVFSAIGASYGTSKAGTAISGMGQMHPSLVFTALLPVIMSGILIIYGLVVSVFIASNRKHDFLVSPNAPISLFS